MKNKKNILMCLQQLDIGGVETAVLTLCKGYKNAGHKVYVAAKPGIYSKQLEDLKIEQLDIEYKIENRYALEKMDELIKFFEYKKITEIHIHQYPCVAYWLPVIMKTKIPYVAYVHSIIPGAPEWFMKTFPIYQSALPIFFENASKIICISERTKKDIEKIFNLDEKKYLIIPNSLDLNEFKMEKNTFSKKNFGLLSRLSEEKVQSITNAIDIFNEYSKNHKECKMIIAGDGPSRKYLENYAKRNKNIQFIGSVSNSLLIMPEIDIYMGVDRTILEAIACKKLAIISNYSGKSILITKDNIKDASKENFSGNNLLEDEDIIKKIESIDEKDYKRITESNYKFINKNYNVNENIYLKELESNFTNDYNKIFEFENKLVEENSKLINELYQKKENSILNRAKRYCKRILKKLFNK